ncbi:6-phosphogluconolactonase isoform X1 [Peromyscus californicus insignis]|uniref:6-phosphogluconolactonase isoform X1 n=1 Tax=Peromyscus californicus insignis TaxID=564181 RepID=UPI0022A6C1DC|nr:6-phosphogluconolactonase isoform X1 [Peromyscus californicus insignis]
MRPRRRIGVRRARHRLPAAAMAAPAPGLISVFSSPQELGASLAQLVAQRAASCLEGSRGRFALGLSGGSLVSMLARDLPAAAAPAGPASLARWTLGFCDERLVPFEHAESTYGLYRTHLLSKLPIPDSQVLTIDPALPVEDAAEDYARKLSQAFQGDAVPVFDLLILGVGPDGHTCSLFPGHPLLQEQEKIVAPISDSPKPPPQRVTLTLPVLNAAQSVIFVATGEGKAAVLKIPGRPWVRSSPHSASWRTRTARCPPPWCSRAPAPSAGSWTRRPRGCCRCPSRSTPRCSGPGAPGLASGPRRDPLGIKRSGPGTLVTVVLGGRGWVGRRARGPPTAHWGGGQRNEPPGPRTGSRVPCSCLCSGRVAASLPLGTCQGSPGTSASASVPLHACSVLSRANYRERPPMMPWCLR